MNDKYININERQQLDTSRALVLAKSNPSVTSLGCRPCETHSNNTSTYTNKQNRLRLNSFENNYYH